MDGIQTSPTKDNWIMKQTNLKKLYKLLSHLNNYLNQPPFPQPDLSAIAKEDNEEEIVLLCSMVLFVLMRCEKNQFYIQKIQELDQDSQKGLMMAIENLIQKTQEAEIQQKETVKAPAAANDEKQFEKFSQLEKEKTLVENQLKRMAEENQKLKYENQSLLQEQKMILKENKELNDRAQQVQKQPQTDIVVLAELETLKQQLNLEAEQLLEQQKQQLADFQKKSEQWNRQSQEMNALKDLKDEYQHLTEKLSKAEIALEKYKKKGDESLDLKRQIKNLEDQQANQMKQYASLEEEYKKISSFKGVMDNYKDQILSLETKNKELLLKQQQMSHDQEQLALKLQTVEKEKSSHENHVQILEERLREMELGGGMPLGAELLGNVEANSGQKDSKLKLKIIQLEKELEKYQKGEKESQKIILLENLLEDANRLKAKYENDFMEAHQKCLKLETDLKASQSESPEVTLQLRKHVTEMESEITQLKLKLSEKEHLLSSSQQDVLVLKSDKSLEQKPLQQLQQKVSELELEKAKQLEQVNQLLQEKNELQNQLLTKQNNDQDNEEQLKNKLKQAAQKIQQLTEQTNTLHQALKKAKDHILSQDQQMKQIKTSTNSNENEPFSEAVHALQNTLKQKEEELGRLQREYKDFKDQNVLEQKLLMSAWYDLGIQSQRKLQGNTTTGSSTSWLAQQRKNILESPFRMK